jgi:hypothetical protein
MPKYANNPLNSGLVPLFSFFIRRHRANVKIIKCVDYLGRLD